MARARRWVKIDIDMLDNPKLDGLPAEAKILFLAGICESYRAMSPGVIRPSTACELADVEPEAGDHLLARGLWHPPGHICPTCVQPGKRRVVIHDYLDWQEDPDRMRRRSEVNRANASRRWANRDANGNTVRNANRTANGSAEEEVDVYGSSLPNHQSGRVIHRLPNRNPRPGEQCEQHPAEFAAYCRQCAVAQKVIDRD